MAAPTPPATNPRVVPLLQAGGGDASSSMRKTPLGSLSGPVMSHLTAIYKSLSPSQQLDCLASVQNEVPTDSLKPVESLQEFLAYMVSPASSAMSPPKSHDLSYPISNYFISTSHNTYLSGNQLYGEASTEAYRNVLIRGCRCLEIDVWDGESDLDGYDEVEGGAGQTSGKEKRNSRLSRFADKIKDSGVDSHRLHNPLHHSSHTSQPAADSSLAPGRLTDLVKRAEPRVLHGHTLTKEVSFRAVCETIRDNAFVATNLPIIVSLEVHASLEQQEIMVEIMRDTWKGLLVDVDDQQENNIEHLPSPDDLRGKILIKVKWTPNSKTGESNNPIDRVASNESDTEEAGETISPDQVQKKKKASKILHALSSLGIYTRAYSFKTFSQPESNIPTHVFSLSEQKVTEISESPYAGALLSHNRNYLMRVFPSGLRVNSSNVEPTFLWKQGAQMVALNWQKWDRGMMLNEGMFAGEGGWVLKPEGYRGTIGKRKGEAMCDKTDVRRKVIDLTIELFAGQDVPLPEKDRGSTFHPYVKMQLHVDNQSTPSTSVKTTTGRLKSAREYDSEDSSALKRRSKSSRTTNPEFGGESLRWAHLSGVIEELSFLRVKIQDDRIGTDDLAAWACIRLDRVQSGLRFIHLLDAKGMESSGVLLVRITKKAA